MSSIYQIMKGCIFKAPPAKPEVEEDEEETNESGDLKAKIVVIDTKEKDEHYHIDKKTDEVSDPSSQPGLLWRVTSGVYSTTTGAVGMGYNSAKWIAGKGYGVGSTAVSYVKVPSLALKKKDKKE